MGVHAENRIGAQLESLGCSGMRENIHTGECNLGLECCCEFLDGWLKADRCAAPVWAGREE